MAQESTGYLQTPKPTFPLGTPAAAILRPEDDVSLPCEEWVEDYEARKLGRDLLQGSDHMKSLSREYLPQEPGEEDDDYANRLQRGYLFNGFGKAARTLAGKPFTRPIKRDPEMAPEIRDLLEDIDGRGNKLEIFAYNLFFEALVDGIAFVLIDMPSFDLPQGARTGQVRLDQIEKENIRPRWILLTADNVIGWRFIYQKSSAPRLTQVRVRQDRWEPVGRFGVQLVERIRVWEPGTYTDYRHFEATPEGGKDEWRVDGSGVYGLDYIPIVPFSAGRRAQFMRGRSPLKDLADINLVHYQSTADQRHILHVARVPILFGAGIGAEDGEELVISPNSAILSNNQSATLGYVETTGGAIAAGKTDLEDLQGQMAEAALDLMAPTGGNFTATAASLDAADTLSEMQVCAMALSDALNEALEITAEMMPRSGSKVVNPGTVEVHNDFAFSYRDIEEMRLIMDARKERDLARKYSIIAMDRRGLLGPDFDAKENDALLEAERQQEAADALDAAQTMAEATMPQGSPPDKKITQKEPIDSTQKTKETGKATAAA